MLGPLKRLLSQRRGKPQAAGRRRSDAHGDAADYPTLRGSIRTFARCKVDGLETATTNCRQSSAAADHAEQIAELKKARARRSMNAEQRRSHEAGKVIQFQLDQLLARLEAKEATRQVHRVANASQFRRKTRDGSGARHAEQQKSESVLVARRKRSRRRWSPSIPPPSWSRLSFGRDQGAVGMTFRLHRPDTYGKPGNEVARIEIVRLRTRARGRITQTGPCAILAATHDQSSGARAGGETVALAGRLDFDGKGEDARARLERMLEDQGCTIDLVLEANGNKRGRLTPKTKYLVVDETPVHGPEDKPERIAYLAKLSAIHREAQELGITVINSRRFLNELGFRLDLRSSR